MRRSFLLLTVAVVAAATSDPWTKADLLQPSEFASALAAHTPAKVFHVGFGILYRGKHISGSTYAGPGSKPEGIRKLLEAVKGIDKNTHIVLYCGCCPLDKCPNIRPAFRALREAGFRDVKVVELPENLNQDWIEKGYPTEAGGAS